MGNYSGNFRKNFQIQISTIPSYPVPSIQLAEIGQYLLPSHFEYKDSPHHHKWEKLLSSYNSNSILRSSEIPKFRRKFIKLTRAGLPSSFRWEAWTVITQLHLRIDEISYKGLPVPDMCTQEFIHKDLDRTFPHHPYFCKEKFGYSGQKSLELVLFKVASKFPSLKYCQSLNFVAGFLLLANGGNDIEAFYMLEAILQDYNLLGFYTEDMLYIKQSVWVFQRLFKREFPGLAVHFERSGIYPEMWIFQWFMTLFTTVLKPSFLLKVWDLFLIDRLPFLYRISLAIIGTFKNRLIKMDIDSISSFLKELGEHIEDEKGLVKYSKKFLVTENTLKKLEKKYEDLYMLQNPQSLEESKLDLSLDISYKDDNFMISRHEILRDIYSTHLVNKYNFQS